MRERTREGLLIRGVIIVEVNRPVIAVSYIAIAGFLWALLVDPSRECQDLSSTALKRDTKSACQFPGETVIETAY